MKKQLEPDCCWLTGEEIFESKAVFPLDHPLAGHVIKIGKNLPGSYRVTLLLMDGTNTAVNIHERVIHDVKDRLVELWNNMRERYIFQTENKNIYYHDYSDDKFKAEMKNTIKKIDNNPPIDVLGIDSWKSLTDLQKSIRI